MATITLSDLDLRTRNAVIRQLDWDPAVDAAGIGVTAQKGAVTLTGYIDTYAGKLAAERAAKKIRGVRAVANDLDVRLRIERTDTDIARDSARALELWAALPGSVQAVVHHGQVTVTGNVATLYQAQAAERAVRHVQGVRGVTNYITVAAGAVAKDVRHRIVEALHRHADVDAKQVDIHVDGSVATLTGTVATWRQRDIAERAAADAPGITRVNNEIFVLPVEPVDELC